MSRPEWLRQVLSTGNEFHFVKQSPWKHNLLNLLALSTVFALFAGTMALCAVLPIGLYLPAVCNLIEVEDPYLRSRTYFYPMRLLFSPFGINYHFEHHANFNVPWYRLRAYHQKVMKLMPEDLKPYFLTRGLSESFQQIAGSRALPPVAAVALRSMNRCS
jgi:fatty acid desaturase